MRLKKVLSLVVTGLLATSFIACGSSSSNSQTASGGSNKIVVWTLSDDLKQFAEHYQEENPGKEVEVTVIAPADYPTKVTTALRGKAETPDIIVGEPQMIPNFMEAGFLKT